MTKISLVYVDITTQEVVCMESVEQEKEKKVRLQDISLCTSYDRTYSEEEKQYESKIVIGYKF